MLLGVDVGGTFTDAVLAFDDQVVTAKAPTTPEDQSEGVIAAVQAALEKAERRASEVETFSHGMTVATNALLQGHGARTALLATEGFTDLIALGRQTRAELYRLCAARPAPLVPDDLRFGVPERMTPDGPLTELATEAADEAAQQVAEADVEAVAVVLLHSYRHPGHERALGEALARALPDAHVSLSHQVVGTFREYERAATTEIDAAISPLLANYLRKLVDSARDADLPEPSIMQSNGGLIDLESAAGHAAWTVLSGPAGGAAGAAFVARAVDAPDALCFDMGGTSCDVCVIDDGAVQEHSAGEIAGRPLALPMLAIHTVGAGGGSIAWRDPGGALRVGPQSAGADPGPACYGRGGTEPTVTDANLVLGLPVGRRAAGRGRRARRRRGQAGDRHARRRARARARGVRRGDQTGGGRRDGPGAAGGDGAAGDRSPPLRAAAVRGRRAAARDADRRGAGDRDDRMPPGLGRAGRTRPRRVAPPPRRPANAAPGRRRAHRRRGRRGRLPSSGSRPAKRSAPRRQTSV